MTRVQYLMPPLLGGGGGSEAKVGWADGNTSSEEDQWRNKQQHTAAVAEHREH